MGCLVSRVGNNAHLSTATAWWAESPTLRLAQPVELAGSGLPQLICEMICIWLTNTH